MASVILDSSAILAHLNNEPGSERVSEFLGDALISAVNYAEVVTKLIEWKVSIDTIRAALSRYGLQIIAFDTFLAEETGALRPKTKAFGLSLGDRACLALAARFQLPVLTTDRVWKELGLPIDIQLLR
jgi:ribonuclease VapC